MLEMFLSIIAGMIPDVLFFTLFISYSKNAKEKKKSLFMLIMIAYILCIMINRYQYVYYTVMIVMIFLILKVLYKEEIQSVDLFLVTIGIVYVMLISFISFKIFGNDEKYYYIALIINKILIFIPLFFKRKLHEIYRKYLLLWDRNKSKKRGIKSITIRNLSIISLCIVILALFKHILIIIESI